MYETVPMATVRRRAVAAIRHRAALPAGLRHPSAFVPAHHLLGEMKTELDWVTNEIGFASVRRAAGRDGLDTLPLEQLLALQRGARERLQRAETAFAFASRYWLLSVVAMNLRRHLFGSRTEVAARADVRHAVRELARALHAYCWDGPADEADDRVREAWKTVERFLFA